MVLTLAAIPSVEYFDMTDKRRLDVNSSFSIPFRYVAMSGLRIIDALERFVYCSFWVTTVGIIAVHSSHFYLLWNPAKTNKSRSTK